LKSLSKEIIHKKSLLKEAFITHNAITVLGLVWPAPQSLQEKP
jgi:hypothetical protein